MWASDSLKKIRNLSLNPITQKEIEREKKIGLVVPI